MDDAVEVEGINYGVRGKAFKFQGDMWDEAEFIPRAHCEWIGDGEDDGRNHGTMRIARWLAKKNGWD